MGKQWGHVDSPVRDREETQCLSWGRCLEAGFSLTFLRHPDASALLTFSPFCVPAGVRAQRALRQPLPEHLLGSSQMSSPPRATCWVTSLTWTSAPQ